MADAHWDCSQANWPINPSKLVRCSSPVSIHGRTVWRKVCENARERRTREISRSQDLAIGVLSVVQGGLPRQDFAQ